jgi:hypothetical protein
MAYHLVASWTFWVVCIAVALSMSCTGDGDREALSTQVSDATARTRIDFTLDQPADSHPVFVWRQGDGVRRFDILEEKDGPISSGYFQVQRQFIGPNAQQLWHCTWTAINSKNARTDCRSLDIQPDIVSELLAALAFAEVTRAGDRQILGRSAECFRWGAEISHSAGIICLDQESRLPLEFATTGSGAVTLRATSIQLNNNAERLEPAYLEPGSAPTDEMPIQDLHLPTLTSP